MLLRAAVFGEDNRQNQRFMARLHRHAQDRINPLKPAEAFFPACHEFIDHVVNLHRLPRRNAAQKDLPDAVNDMVGELAAAV